LNIQIEKTYFDTYLLPQLPEGSDIGKQANSKLRHGSTKFDLDISMLTVDELDGLYELAQMTENRSMMVQLAPMRKILRDVDNTVVTSLKSFPLGLIEMLKQNLIDGWLYHIDESAIPNPYLVKSINYIEAKGIDDRAYVKIDLVANNTRYASGAELYKRSISIDSDDMSKKTIHQILANDKFYIETPELKEIYNANLELFKNYQPQFNKQFWFNGKAQADHDYYSSRRASVSGVSKIINEEGTVSRKYVRNSDASFWKMKEVTEGFDIIPFHTYIKAFSLAIHQEIWVHISQITPYKYDKTLREKLVLPQSHRDLIDILVEDMDFLKQDIIEGKSGGTTILCTGNPGLGKTLSAEVYSEVIERPLYRVHSGQLGLTSDAVQKNLEEILKRASRWGAILLIDEADVYIRNRGNDLQHNAVVASFLRTLEYFDGLMFMTTNRGEDVDDAILSRCIAVVRYETPTKENSTKIWKVLSTQFGVTLPEFLIQDLVVKFPTASGRDIKELLKLTSKFAKGKNIPLDMEAFRKCAQFRGLSLVE
jgi:hypothetical protein